MSSRCGVAVGSRGQSFARKTASRERRGCGNHAAAAAAAIADAAIVSATMEVQLELAATSNDDFLVSSTVDEAMFVLLLRCNCTL